jgi:phosphatidylinositol mannoside-binding LppM-like protein
MTQRLRTVVRIAGFGVLALLLSACLKLDMDLQVSEDNTVSGSIIFGVNKQLIELTGGSVEDFLGTDSPLPSDAEGVTTEPFEDDEFIGQRFVFDSVPLAQLSSGGPDELRITREGDTFNVIGALDLAAGVTGATGATGLSGFPGAEQFLQGAQLKIKITFPGPVTDTNGEVDGNTVTWVPVVGERLELRATASAIPSGGGSNLTMLLIIAAVIVVLAIVAGIVVAQRRNRPAVAATGFGGSAGAAPPVAGEPGPLPPASPSPPAAPPPPPPPPGDPQP